MFHYNDFDGKIKVVEKQDSLEIYFDGELYTVLDNTITNAELDEAIAEIISEQS